MLEIGPGGGVLTRALLGAGAARVLAWELDPAWAFRLRAGLPATRVAIAVGDALELAWERLPAGALVAGNLPYNVGTAIVERLLRSTRGVPRAAFLLQREVVDRIVARPGDADYGALSVLVAVRARARRLGRLPPSAFVPPPKVESAFVGLLLGEPAVPWGELDALARVVRIAFSAPRKTLRNTLGAAWGRATAEALLAELGLTDRARAEELDAEAHIALFRAAKVLGVVPSKPWTGNEIP